MLIQDPVTDNANRIHNTGRKVPGTTLELRSWRGGLPEEKFDKFRLWLVVRVQELGEDGEGREGAGHRLQYTSNSALLLRIFKATYDM